MKRVDYETMVQQLYDHPNLCASHITWPPTQFIKIDSYLTMFKIDTALRSISIYKPKLSDNLKNCWTIHEGGELYGNLNTIRL